MPTFQNFLTGFIAWWAVAHLTAWPSTFEMLTFPLAALPTGHTGFVALQLAFAMHAVVVAFLHAWWTGWSAWEVTLVTTYKRTSTF